MESIEQGVQALVDGQIDFLHELPYRRSWLEQLQGAAGIKLVQTPWSTTAYLALDQGSAELRSSDVKGKNPFKDKRVRQALYQAIDIDTLVDEVMGGLATPAAMLIPPGITGYFPELAKRPPYDPSGQGLCSPRRAIRTALRSSSTVRTPGPCSKRKRCAARLPSSSRRLVSTYPSSSRRPALSWTNATTANATSSSRALQQCSIPRGFSTIRFPAVVGSTLQATPIRRLTN